MATPLQISVEPKNHLIEIRTIISTIHYFWVAALHFVWVHPKSHFLKPMGYEWEDLCIHQSLKQRKKTNKKHDHKSEIASRWFWDRYIYIYTQSIIDYICILTTKLYKSMMYRLYRSCRITVLKKISPKTFRRATTAIFLSSTTCCFPSIRTGYLQMSGTHLPAQPWSRAAIPLYYFIH